MNIIKCCYGCVGIEGDTVMDTFLFCANLKDTKTVNIFLNILFQIWAKSVDMNFKLQWWWRQHCITTLYTVFS